MSRCSVDDVAPGNEMVFENYSFDGAWHVQIYNHSSLIVARQKKKLEVTQ